MSFLLNKHLSAAAILIAVVVLFALSQFQAVWMAMWSITQLAWIIGDLGMSDDLHPFRLTMSLMGIVSVLVLAVPIQLLLNRLR